MYILRFFFICNHRYKCINFVINPYEFNFLQIINKFEIVLQVMNTFTFTTIKITCIKMSL